MLFAAFAALTIASAPALAQKSGSDGVYGGYVGSSRQLQMEMDSARQRANLDRALKRSGGEGGAATGAALELHIAFPPEQRGISNIQTVRLQPKDDGAHSAMSLAVIDRQKNAINASFSATKDVKPGHSYQVVLESAGGTRYPIGEIRVNKPGQSFELAAPLLGQSSAQKR